MKIASAPKTKMYPQAIGERLTTAASGLIFSGAYLRSAQTPTLDTKANSARTRGIAMTEANQGSTPKA